MKALTRLSLKNRALISLICVCVAIFGIIAATSLKQELFPEFQNPQAVVATTYQGATPEAVEKEVTDPLEDALNGLESVEKIDSQSSTGTSQITVQTKYGTDSDDTVRELQRAVSQVQNQLPDGVTPQVMSGGTNDIPVLVLSVTGDGDSPAATDRMAQELTNTAVPDLKKVDGVRSATVSGARTKQVSIKVRKDDLKDEGASVDEIASVLQANGITTSAGSLAGGNTDAPVEVGKRITSVGQIKDLAVTGEDGPIKLSKVATVKEGNAPITSVSRTNGTPSLTLMVTKKPDANTVDVAKAVQAALPDVAKKIDGNPQFTTLFDQSPFIQDSIKDLATEGVMGLVFAVLVILVFLFSVRATLITAISIPMSLLITLIALWQSSYSLNMLTLAALTISIGRVVDDSIVVIEAIRRRQTAGGTKFANVLSAVGEVAGAITASTLTTVAVFAPLIFVSGQAGELFRPFALTVTIALLSSLAVALTIVPVLAYWFLRARESRVRLQKEDRAEIRTGRAQALAGLRSARKDERRREKEKRKGKQTGEVAGSGLAAAGGAASATTAATSVLPAAGESESGPDELANLHSPVTRLQKTYLPVVRATTRHPVITLAAAVIILLLTFSLVPRMKTELLGDTGGDTLQAQQTFPASDSLQKASARAKTVEQLLARTDGIKSYEFSVGDDPLGFGGGGGGRLQGSYLITLDDGADSKAVSADLQQRFAGLKNQGELTMADTNSTGSSTIDVKLSSNDTAHLRTAADDLTKKLRSQGFVKQVTNDQAATKKVVQVRVDHKKAAKKGLSEASIGQAVARAMDGQNIGSVVLDTTTQNVKLFDGKVTDVDELKKLKIKVSASAGASSSASSAGSAGAASGGSSESAGSSAGGSSAGSAGGAQAGGKLTRVEKQAAATSAPASPPATTTPCPTPTSIDEPIPTNCATASTPPVDADSSSDGNAGSNSDGGKEGGQDGNAQSGAQGGPQGNAQGGAQGGPQGNAQGNAQGGPGQQVPGGGQMPDTQIPGGNPSGQTPTAQQPSAADSGTKTIKLSSVAAVVTTSTSPVIGHSDGLRTATVSVTPSGDDLGKVSQDVQQLVNATKFPSGVSTDLGGATQEQADSFSQLGLAMLAAILIVFVILVATFKSLLQPFILLVSIPFAATGAIGLLVATNTPLGLTALIGMLMLIGIVVTNAIVLIDLINHFRAHGVPLREAVLQGARLRYRPIIMTALATIFALTPMGLGLTGGGVFISKPLAIVVIGGLVSSTLLTLILVPVLYQLLEGVRERRTERKRARDEVRASVIARAEARAGAATAGAGAAGEDVPTESFAPFDDGGSGSGGSSDGDNGSGEGHTGPAH